MRIIVIATCLVFCLLVAGVAWTDTDRGQAPDHDMPRNVAALRSEAFSATDDIDWCALQRYQGDTMRIVAILVEWTNQPGTFPPEDFEDLLFSRGVWPGGSMAEYFDEVSYGQLTIVGGVEGWFNVGDEYVAYNSVQWDSIVGVLDPYIDYSQYDANGDDTVDAVIFIPAGYDVTETWNSAVDIRGIAWEHFGINALGPFDGVLVNRLCLGPEKRPLRDPDNLFEFTGEDAVNRIFVFCHELSHNLSLPDLYDYDGGSDQTFTKPNDRDDYPLVDWCIMDGTTGSRAFRIDNPFHLCGWSKMKLEWIEPVVLQGEFEDLVIYNIESHNDSALYMLPITPEEGEYFLLEYRTPYGSHMFGKYGSDMSRYFYPDMDWGEELIERGLLITHVHDSLFAGFCICDNNGFPDYPNYVIAVEDAGYNPDKDYTYNPEGRITDSSKWWCPYESRKGALFSNEVEGQNVFGPETTPSSEGYFGPTNIYVRVDSMVGDRLYAYVNTDYTEPSYVCGDANGDGQVDQLDVAYLIDYLRKDGPPPDPMEAGDANGDGVVDSLDSQYLIDYLHRGGPPPVCP